MKAVGKTVLTNVPRDLVPGIADVATRIGRTSTYRAVITHPLVRSGYDARGSIQMPDIAGIRALATTLFTPPGTPPPRSTRCHRPRPRLGLRRGYLQAGGDPSPDP